MIVLRPSNKPDNGLFCMSRLKTEKSRKTKMHRFGRKRVGRSNDFVIVKQYSRVSSIKTIVNKAVFN